MGSASALPGLARASEGGGGSLPQLDFHFYAGQLFWLAITFPLLFLVMRFLAVPRVQNAQSKRRQALRCDLDAAAADQDAARALQAAYEKSLLEARSKASVTLNDMAAAAARDEAARREVQQKELASRVAEAEKRIAVFREKSMGEARTAAADLAEAIVDKLVGMKKA